MSARWRLGVVGAGRGRVTESAGVRSAVALALLALLAGCGRSDLTSEELGTVAVAGSDAEGPGASADANPDGRQPPEGGVGSPPVDAGPSPASEAGVVGCNAATCSSGCCDADGLCEFGVVASACGSGGVACGDCASAGLQCLPTNGRFACGASTPPCDPMRCAGCCDANGQCQPGSVDNACGQSGARCADCSLSASHCRASGTGRGCVATGLECPAVYGGCAGGQTPLPVSTRSCSAQDLLGAGSACSAGAHTPACALFFDDEAARNPACTACLRPFDFDFVELSGLFACAAPWVDPNCNTRTFCLSDCVASTCAGCGGDPTARQQCENDALRGGCAGYVASVSCVAAGLFGLGNAVDCDPQFYADYGAWLQAVGSAYCAR